MKWEQPADSGSSPISEYVVKCSTPRRDGNTTSAIIFRGLANECEWNDENTKVISSSTSASSASASSSSQAAALNTISSQLALSSALDEQGNAMVSICVICLNGEGLESDNSDPFVIPIHVSLHWDSTSIGNLLTLSPDKLSVVKTQKDCIDQSSAWGSVPLCSGGTHAWTIAITATDAQWLGFGIAPKFDNTETNAHKRGWCWTRYNETFIQPGCTASGVFEQSLFQTSPTLLTLEYNSTTGILSATHLASKTVRTISNIITSNKMNQELFPFVWVHNVGNKVEIVRGDAVKS